MSTNIQCPFCDSVNIELFSLYGQTLLGSQYYCYNCQSIFEAVRYDDGNQDDELVEHKPETGEIRED